MCGSENIKEKLKTENCIIHPTVMIRKAILENIGGYREDFRNAEDYELWIRISEKYSIENIPKPLVRYRLSINGMSLLLSKWEQYYYSILAICLKEVGYHLDKAVHLANYRYQKTDKQYFITEVTKGNFKLLIQLGFYSHAIRLLKRSYRDINFSGICKVLKFYFNS